MELGRLNGEAFIVAAKNGAFAGRVDQNKGLVAGTTERGEEMRFDASTFKCSAVDLRGIVVAKLSNVARAESPELASDHRAGHFPARKNAGRVEFDLGAAYGEFL